MINKLKNKIFWLLEITLMIISSAVILLFLLLNYRSTMDTVSSIMQSDFKEDSYIFSVENSKVTSNEGNADGYLEELAVKATSKNNETGVIGNYLYKYRNMGPGVYSVSLVLNVQISNYLKALYVFSGIAFIFSIIITLFISKNISYIIVKPVQETLEKQKQFISDASHELKTPLSIIEVNSDMIEKKFGQNKWINYINQETESMNKLINDLLLLARTENPQNINKYEQFDLSNEIDIIASTFDIVAYDKNVKIEKNISKNIKFNGDKEDINHIVSTLLDNAIKHTYDGKLAYIELSKEKGEIILQVKNEGEPIPVEEQDKIFERFYRVDKSRNRKEKRYGLGLAIAKSTVQKDNGKIEVICKDGITNFKVKLFSK